MSAFKTKIIITLGLLTLVLASFLLPCFVSAQIAPTVSLTRFAETQDNVHGSGNYNWAIKGIFPGATLGNQVTITVGERKRGDPVNTPFTDVPEGKQTIAIQNINGEPSIEYQSGYILYPDHYYVIRGTLSGFTIKPYSNYTNAEDTHQVIISGNTTTSVGSDYKPTYASPSDVTTNSNNNVKTELNYYPLVGLPGLEQGKELNLTPSCDADGKNCKPGIGFAGYLNILIRIFIGICAILAMIMIVMGGIQYMTSELVSSKQAAKESIMNAILGLLLALGAFAILNTINPDLLNVGLGNLPTVTVTLQDEQETPGMAVTSSNAIPPSGSYTGCPEGLEQISTSGGKMYLCKKISADVKKMIDLAWSQGYKLFGGSYRSKEAQINLRKQYCG
ncbi:MAG: hypothetical protein WCO09_02405, partial [bacterium]